MQLQLNIIIGLTLVFGGAQTAQSAVASISGRVVSEAGASLRANLTLSFAAALGYPAPPRRVTTGTNGAFVFSKLPAERYVLCEFASWTRITSCRQPRQRCLRAWSLSCN